MMLIDTLGGAETRSARRSARVIGVDPELLHAYAAETARLVRQRLGLVAPLFVVLMGSGVAFEIVFRPERRSAVLVAWLVESGLVVLAALATRVPALERQTGPIGALMMGGVATCVTLYHVLIGAQPERDAMTFGA